METWRALVGAVIVIVIALAVLAGCGNSAGELTNTSPPTIDDYTVGSGEARYHDGSFIVNVTASAEAGVDRVSVTVAGINGTNDQTTTLTNEGGGFYAGFARTATNPNTNGTSATTTLRITVRDNVGQTVSVEETVTVGAMERPPVVPAL